MPGFTEPSFESTSSTLLEAARAHQPGAWDRMVALYSPLIDRWCRSLRLPSDYVDDIRQEVLKSASGKLHQFDEGQVHSTFRGWLYTITLNAVRAHGRAQRRREESIGGSEFQQRLLSEPANQELDVNNELSEQAELYQRALQLIQNEFAEHRWQAFWRFTVDECPVSEVAEELGMTPGAVRKAKFDVLKRLKDEFGELLR